MGQIPLIMTKDKIRFCVKKVKICESESLTDEIKYKIWRNKKLLKEKERLGNLMKPRFGRKDEGEFWIGTLLTKNWEFLL